MKLFCNLFFITFFLFSFESLAFNPGKDSQFVGSNVIDPAKGKEGIKIDNPDKAIILIYNQGWGISNTKSKYVRGKDPCFVNTYLDNQKKYTPGLLGPWYSLASELSELIKEKNIYLYYFCKNRAQEGFDADTLRTMQANNLIKLVDAFVKEGVPRANNSCGAFGRGNGCYRGNVQKTRKNSISNSHELGGIRSKTLESER